jgi:RNA recognition motif-containing protein
LNIYVGNLSFTATENDLREAFQAFGAVEKAAIITDKATGQSRGFGFVEMPSREEAEKAIAALNGRDLKGRAIKVNEAQARTDRPRGGGGGFGGGVIRGCLWKFEGDGSPKGPSPFFYF